MLMGREEWDPLASPNRRLFKLCPTEPYGFQEESPGVTLERNGVIRAHPTVHWSVSPGTETTANSGSGSSDSPSPFHAPITVSVGLGPGRSKGLRPELALLPPWSAW